MSIGDTTLTVVGNLTKDPELRIMSNTGTSVVSFTVASSRRVWDKDTNAYKDGDTIFMRCSAWRHLADHVAETLEKGTRVIVSGRLSQREYEDNKGVQRTIMELQVEEIGPSLKYATATMKKVARGGTGGEPPHPGDAWSAGQTSGQNSAGGGGWGGGYAEDEPPF